MPIYEYEPIGRDCLICNGTVEVIQNITDEPLTYCPTCGLEVKRIVSRATFKLGSTVNSERAAQKGFTTFKRVEKGKWEKVGGEGPDMIVGTPEDVAAVEAEKKPAKKPIDLD